MSFYGVYDGHAGKDAAAFTASHLHGRIMASQHYPADLVAAIKDAFNRTDEAFLEKVKFVARMQLTLLLAAEKLIATWLYFAYCRGQNSI